MNKGKSIKMNAGWTRKAGILASFVLLCAVFAILTDKFLTVGNIRNILLQSSINGTIAIGMTMVIITSGIHLSVGSIMALSSMIAAKLMVSGCPFQLALLVALLIGLLLGALDGLLISTLKLQPFLVTMGTMSAYRGLTLIISDGLPVRGLNRAFLNGMNSLNTSIPIPIILWLALTVIFAFVMKYTRYGQYIFAIGGNEEAARFSCVNTVAVKTLTYSFSGLCCAVAAIIYMGRLAAADPQAGDGYEMNAIASAAIGGASLAGGKGSLSGTLIGALILAVLSNGLTLINVQSFYQTFFVGIIIIVATIIDRFANKA